MRIAGSSSAEIAEALKIHRSSVWRMLEEALADRRREIAEGTETLRALENAAIDEYIQSLRPAALAGDPAAHRGLIRWHERRARLNDLDLQREIEQAVPEVHVHFAVPPLPPEPGQTVEDGEFEVVEPRAIEAGGTDASEAPDPQDGKR